MCANMRIPKSPDWVRECPRRIMVGFHFPDYDQAPEYAALVKQGKARPILADFDARAVVKELKKAKVQAFYFYNKCHRGNAYYPSQAPGAHVHSIVAEKGDLFGQLCEACLAEGIVPLAVYEFSDLRIPFDHPAWCHKRYLTAEEREWYQNDANVKKLVDFTDGQQGSRTEGPCLNGPYGDYAIAQACETVRNYPVEGYYVDFLGLFTFGKWVCPYCGPRFKKDLGFEFQGIDQMTRPQRIAYAKWHYAQNAAYIDKMRRAIEEIRPGLVFVHNFHGGYAQTGMQTWEMAHTLTSFATGDLFTLRGGQLQIDWKLRGYVAASRMKPAELLLDSVVCVGGEAFTPKALDSFRAEMWTARAQNVATMTGYLPTIDGRYDARQIALFKKVFNEIAPYEPWLRDMEPVYNVGLLRSGQTLEFLENDPEYLPAESHHEVEFQGWCQALIQGHFLWDVLHDHLVTESYLRRFAVLILPNAVCLSSAQCKAIAAYIWSGGCVIATGETSVADENGERHRDFTLADALGVRLVQARDPKLNRMIIKERALKPREPWVTDALAYTMGQCRVQPARNARSLADIFSSLAVPLINTFEPMGAPGLVQYQYGQGTALYFAGLPGLHYRVFGADTWRRLMGAVVARLAGRTAPVTLEAPGSVELYAHRQAGKKHLVVNLVNWLPGCSRSDGRVNSGSLRDDRSKHLRFDEIAVMPPAGDVTLRFRVPRGRKIKRVYLAPDRRPLRLKQAGREMIVVVPKLTLHAMVVAEFT